MPAAPVYTPEFVERGYNNRAAVPDHPRWFAQYAQWSAAAFDRHRPARNVRYGPGPKEVLDVFAPAGKPRGTLVFLHGGYWRALDKDDFAFVAAPFVAAGIAGEFAGLQIADLRDHQRQQSIRGDVKRHAEKDVC